MVPSTASRTSAREESSAPRMMHGDHSSVGSSCLALAWGGARCCVVFHNCPAVLLRIIILANLLRSRL